MKAHRIFYNALKLITISLLLIVTSCSNQREEEIIDDVDDATTSASTTTITAEYASGTHEGSAETGYDEDDLLENSTFSTTVSIVFGTTVTVNNPLSDNGVSVTETNGDVTVTSTAKEVAYVLSGESASGSVKFYSDNKFKLTLNGVTLTNNDGPAINIQSSKRVFVEVADNTTNSLTDGSSYAASEEDMKGTVFSEGQLVFVGSGNLSIKGNYKHALASDDYVRIHSGAITITGAVTDGIHTNDAVIIDGGTLNIKATSDGIECEEGFVVVNAGTLTLNTGDDGIAASYEEEDETITPYVTINGGIITVNSSAGEGIESKSVLTINDGTIATTTKDDGLNAGTAIYINGGSVYSYSTGNDAMDSNGTFTITGGKVLAIGARSPEAGIDCDARTLKITGGIVVGIGGATSSPSASASAVPSVIMGSGSANQIIHIEAADGTEALTFLAPVSYSTMLFASSKMQTGVTYSIYTGGSVTSAEDFYGLFTGGNYTKGTLYSTFTTSTMVTQIGGSVSRG